MLTPAAIGLAFLTYAFVAQTPSLDSALQHLKAGRAAEAEALLASAPESADSQFYLGIARYQQGKAAAAVAPLERAAQLGPKRSAIWKALGLARSAAGDLAGAEEPFRKACDLDPRNELACYNLGRNLQAQNRNSEAAAALRRSLENEREFNRWLVARALALALEAQGDLPAAERHYAASVRAIPAGVRASEDPRVDYGRFLFRQGRLEEALTPLRAAVSVHPSAATAQFELARVLAQLGDQQAAARHLEAAVAADPGHSGAHLLLGQVYLRLGRRAEAERELRTGRELAGRN